MPYYIGDVVKDAGALAPRDPAYFKKKYNIEVRVEHEALSIDPEGKRVTVKNLRTGEVFRDSYDKLVLATGARAFVPPIPGADRGNVFVLRGFSDMYKIKEFMDSNKPGRAAIVGTGFIGQELCESFRELGMDVVMLEMLPQVTPGLDPDMAAHVEEHLKEKGVSVITGVSVEEITENGIRLSDGRSPEADMVILATGIRPNVEIAKAAGIETGPARAIRVNSRMETSVKDIYACGDCIEQFHVVTGKPVYRPLGTTANKTGRIAGENLSGGDLEFRGVLGTGIFRIFDLTVALTGLSEREALNEGYSVATCYHSQFSKPGYMGGQEMIIKGIADRESGRLLGVQIVGRDGVDKRIDIFATAITFGAKVEDLVHLDLAYSPPYSNVKDPVMYTGMILEGEIKKTAAPK